MRARRVCHNERGPVEAAEYDLMFRIEQRYWWYVGRRFLVTRLLRRWLAPEKPLVLLDVGAGTGANLLAFQDLGATHGCEIAPAGVAYCHARGLTQVVHQPDLDKLPFKDATFDAVTCLDVIEHIRDDVGMMREIARVLKPGGAVLFTTPAHKILWSVHDESVHHERRYSMREFRNKLGQAGMHPERLTYLNFWLLWPIVPVRWLRDKFTRSKGTTSDFNLDLPDWLNALFTWIFKSEWLWLKFLPLPLGLSICALGRKPKT